MQKYQFINRMQTGCLNDGNTLNNNESAITEIIQIKNLQ